jgi:hypothetical protein
MKRNALIAPLCCLAGLCLAQPQVAKAQAVWLENTERSNSEEVSTEYAAGSVLVSGFNVLAIVNNTGAPDSSPKWGYLGVLGGVLGMGLGGASLVENSSDDAKPLAIANIAIGALTTVSAMSAIIHARRVRPEEQAMATGVHFAAGVVGARGHQHGLGVQLTF